MPPSIDLTGKKFGRWLVLGKHPKISKRINHWDCRCECGTERVIDTSALNSGRRKSCGCYRSEAATIQQNAKSEIAGEQFGFLTAIERGPIRQFKSKRAMSSWICECVCGSVKPYLTQALKRGYTKSCGCKTGLLSSKSNYRGPYKALITGVYCLYKRTAEKKKRPFKIKRNDFEKLLSMDCHYCGRPPSNTIKKKKGVYCEERTFTYNWIDRIDNSKGYEYDNIVTCCRECNIMKHDFLNYDEMKAVAAFLREFRRKKLEQNI